MLSMLINNAVLVSGVKHGFGYTYTCIYLFFKSFHLVYNRILSKFPVLYHTSFFVGYLFLNVVMCICQLQTPSLSLPAPFPLLVTISSCFLSQ